MSLNVNNAPKAHELGQLIPSFIMNFDPLTKEEGSSLVIHVLRSTLTIAVKTALVVLAAIEIIACKAIELGKRAIDATLSKETQEKIVTQVAKGAAAGRDAAAKLYNAHVAPLFAKK